MIEARRADLDAGRSGASDEQLTAVAESLARDAVTKDEHLAEKAHSQGETVEAIDARIKRLEGAASNHQRSVANLGIEVTRLYEASPLARKQIQLRPTTGGRRGSGRHG
jgi:hypothetical protein